jgi:hypothetical protein
LARAEGSAMRAARKSGGTVWTTPVESFGGMGILYTGWRGWAPGRKRF